MAVPTQKAATDRIERGLQDYERRRNGDPSPLAHLPGLAGLMTLHGVVEYGAEAQRRYTRVTEFYDSIPAALAEFRETEEKRFAGIGFRAKADRDHALELSVAAEKKRLLSVTGLAQDRERIRGELREQAAKAAQVRALWADPIAVLVREHASTEKAARWRSAVAASGPNEIRGLLQTAIATADHALAVACFSRMDSLPDSDRRHIGISKSDVAEVLVGAACQRAVLTSDAIAYLADRVDYRAREVAGERISSDEKIALGARAKTLAGFFEPPSGEGDEGGEPAAA